MNIGKSLRIAIATSGIRQGEVAEMSGITASYVSSIANGRVKPSLDIIEKISRDAFGIKVSEFIALGE